MRNLLLVFLGMLMVLPMQAQQDPEVTPKPIYKLTNPQQTISRHLYYLRNEDGQFNEELAVDALSDKSFDKGSLLQLSKKLKQLYDSKGIYIRPEEIPSDPNYVNEDNKNRYFVAPSVYPELYVEQTKSASGATIWLYSDESVRSIDKLYRETIPSITRSALEAMPSFLETRVLGLAIWKYLGLLASALLAFLLFFLLKAVFSFTIKKFIGPLLSKTTPIDVSLIPPVTKPLSLFTVAWVLISFMIPALLLPIQVSKYIVLALKALMPLFGVLVLIRFVDIVADISKKLATRTESNFDDQAIPIIVKGAKLVVGVLGTIVILQALEVNVTALLAGVSIGGLALALAAQDTVKNFIGSMAIFFDKPFIVGDFIVTADLSGVVTEVGLRSTRIRALDGAQVSLPNGKLVDMVITNHGVRTYRRYATTLGLTYDTPTNLVEKFVEGVREIAKTHPKSREDSVTVQFHEMADSSLSVFFAVIYDTVDYGDWLKARQEVFVDVMNLAKQLGVEFAFPSTSVYVESMPQHA